MVTRMRFNPQSVEIEKAIKTEVCFLLCIFQVNVNMNWTGTFFPWSGPNELKYRCENTLKDMGQEGSNIRCCRVALWEV